MKRRGRSMDGLKATVFMLIVWLVVFLRTAKGMASGKIFLPVH